MPLTLFKQDTFTRANQSGWGTASDGNTWTGFVGSPTLSIASNEGKATGIASDFALYLSTGTVADTEVVVRLTNSDFANDDSGVYLRVADSSNFYRCFIGTGTINIDKKVAGTFTGAIATASITLTNNTYYWIRFHAQGTTLSARYWLDGNSEPGTYNITVTDSSLSAAGKVGVGSYQNATGNTVQFDNFSAYTITTTTNVTTSVTETTAITETFAEKEALSLSETATTTETYLNKVVSSLSNVTPISEQTSAFMVVFGKSTNTTSISEIIATALSLQILETNTVIEAPQYLTYIQYSNVSPIAETTATIIAPTVSSSNPAAQMLYDDVQVQYNRIVSSQILPFLKIIATTYYTSSALASSTPGEIDILYLNNAINTSLIVLRTINDVNAFLNVRYKQMIINVAQPLSYYSLDETSGLVAIDTMNNHNATLSSSGITYAQVGALYNSSSTAMKFDGVNGVMTLSSGLEPGGWTAFTFECWVKVATTISGYQRLCASDDVAGTNRGFEIVLAPPADGNTGYFNWGLGTTHDGIAFGSGALTPGTWYHLVAVYDGSHGVTAVYLNGTAAGNYPVYDGPTTAGAGPFTVAAGPSTKLNATIDELAMYNRPLSASEVLAHYNVGSLA